MLACSTKFTPLKSLVLDVEIIIEASDIKKEHLPHNLLAASNIRNMSLTGFIDGQVGETCLKP